MSDVAATTQEGAATSSDPRFDGFFSSNSIVDTPPRDQDMQTTTQTEPEDSGDDASKFAAHGDAQPDKGTEAVAAEDAPQFASLNEMLAAHKIDPDSVMGLHVTTKIDGQEKQVPLSEVLKSYQLEGHVNNKSIELSNQRSAFDQERQAVRTLFQQQLQQNQQMGHLARQMLNHDFNKVDWNMLRANNPAEFAALNAEFQQRQNAIDNYMGQLNQQAQQEEQNRQAMLPQILAAENEKLMNRVPEWRDTATFSKDRQEIAQYARSLGFQDAELNQIHDHRYMLILRDAARYQGLQAAAPNALKQVRQAPPMVAPGSRTEVNPREAQRKAVVERLNRNPRDADAQAAAFDFFANQ